MEKMLLTPYVAALYCHPSPELAGELARETCQSNSLELVKLFFWPKNGLSIHRSTNPDEFPSR